MVGQGVRRSPGLKLGKHCVDGLTGRRQADGQAANAEGFAITSEVNSDLCIKCLKVAKAYVCGGGRDFANFVEMMHAVLTADEWCNSKTFVRYAWDSVSAHFRLDLQEVNRDLLDEIYAKVEGQ